MTHKFTAFWKINYYKFYPCLKWTNQRAVLYHVSVDHKHFAIFRTSWGQFHFGRRFLVSMHPNKKLKSFEHWTLFKAKDTPPITKNVRVLLPYMNWFRRTSTRVTFATKFLPKTLHASRNTWKTAKPTSKRPLRIQSKATTLSCLELQSQANEGVCLETICNVIDEREEIAEEDTEEEEESDDDDENEFWFRLVNYCMSRQLTKILTVRRGIFM